MFGTLPELERADTSQSDRSSVALVTPARVSATWMPMTSELGAPRTVTVRFASYLVDNVPS